MMPFPLRVLRARLRWLCLRTTLAEWFLPPTAHAFERLVVEAAALEAEAAAYVRQLERAVNDG